VRQAASPPGFLSSGSGSIAEGAPALANVTTRYQGAESRSLIAGLRPLAFALSCIYAEPNRPSFPTDCIVRVSGRNARTAAFYRPYDFY
jgi:hypothetical protein